MMHLDSIQGTACLLPRFRVTVRPRSIARTDLWQLCAAGHEEMLAVLQHELYSRDLQHCLALPAAGAPSSSTGICLPPPCVRAACQPCSQARCATAACAGSLRRRQAHAAQHSSVPMPSSSADSAATTTSTAGGDARRCCAAAGAGELAPPSLTRSSGATCADADGASAARSFSCGAGAGAGVAGITGAAAAAGGTASSAGSAGCLRRRRPGACAARRSTARRGCCRTRCLAVEPDAREQRAQRTGSTCATLCC